MYHRALLCRLPYNFYRLLNSVNAGGKSVPQPLASQSIMSPLFGMPQCAMLDGKQNKNQEVSDHLLLSQSSDVEMNANRAHCTKQ